jgi:hypothetical protein
MNSLNKYYKYKYKYLNLKKQLGGYEDIQKIFFETYVSFYYSSSIRAYIEKIYGISIIDEKEITDDYIICLIDILNIICEIFYNSMSEISKSRSHINILSYGTGVGFVEAYYALFLKLKYGKIVSLVMLEISNEYVKINMDYISNGEKIYNIVIDLTNDFIEIPEHIIDGKIIKKQLIPFRTQLSHIADCINKGNSIHPKLITFYKHLLIDIFFAFNPQDHKYNSLIKAFINFIKHHGHDFVPDSEILIAKIQTFGINIIRENNNEYIQLQLNRLYSHRQNIIKLYNFLIIIEQMHRGIVEDKLAIYSDVPIYNIIWEDKNDEIKSNLTLNNIFCDFFDFDISIVGTDRFI